MNAATTEARHEENLLHLLHVEDDPAMQRLLSRMLEDFGDADIVITAVLDEEMAVRRFALGGIDLVVLDHRLARGDGIQCLRRLRRLDPFLPVLVLTGSLSKQTLADFVDAGVDGFLQKSLLSRERLHASLREMLHRARTTRQRVRAGELRRLTALVQQLADACQPYLLTMAADVDARLAKFTLDATAAQLSIEEMRRIFNWTCDALRQRHPSAAVPAALLRPLFLEASLRLFGDIAADADPEQSSTASAGPQRAE